MVNKKLSDYIFNYLTSLKQYNNNLNNDEYINKDDDYQNDDQYLSMLEQEANQHAYDYQNIPSINTTNKLTYDHHQVANDEIIAWIDPSDLNNNQINEVANLYPNNTSNTNEDPQQLDLFSTDVQLVETIIELPQSTSETLSPNTTESGLKSLPPSSINSTNIHITPKEENNPLLYNSDFDDSFDDSFDDDNEPLIYEIQKYHHEDTYHYYDEDEEEDEELYTPFEQENFSNTLNITEFATEKSCALLNELNWDNEYFPFFFKIFNKKRTGPLIKNIKEFHYDGYSAEEIIMAYNIKQLWRNNEHYHIVLRQFTRYPAINICWYTALKLIRLFGYQPTLDEIYELLEESYDYWYNNHRLQENFYTFYLFIKVRVNSNNLENWKAELHYADNDSWQDHEDYSYINMQYLSDLEPIY